MTKVPRAATETSRELQQGQHLQGSAPQRKAADWWHGSKYSSLVLDPSGHESATGMNSDVVVPDMDRICYHGRRLNPSDAARNQAEVAGPLCSSDAAAVTTAPSSTL